MSGDREVSLLAWIMPLETLYRSSEAAESLPTTELICNALFPVILMLSAE
jgi:hypothetical protein